jgi:exopolyphosphatase / guanosine-5'-triphosphate,3'-diphosphate pyrophosphatase
LLNAVRSTAVRVADPRALRETAVIDVGSNSVRLVIYRLQGRAIWTIYNEKVLAGLGRDLSETGRLAPQGVEQALEALRRFSALLDAMPGVQIFTAATAAVREAADGPAFLSRVEQEVGLRLRVISGPEEARYAALGVTAGQPDAQGIVGDLGGASLELTRLGGPQKDAISLPLGPFSVAGAASKFDPDRLKGLIGKALAPYAKRFSARDLHAVGGAWRNFALLHMRMSNYPLEVLHQYEISRSDALSAARFVARQSQDSLGRTPGLSRKRVETLPYAAVLLECLIEQLELETLTLSAFGLREGLIFESMDAQLRKQDPLVEGCAALAARAAGETGFGPTLAAWVAPVFSALPPVFDREPLLTIAACQLADLGAQLHPDHRADLVFAQVLRAPVPGQTHAERAFIAAAAYSRYTSSFAPQEPEVISRLLSAERVARARALGAAIRLGCDLSGRNTALLGHSSLSLKGSILTLSIDAGHADLLLGEQTVRRATSLATRLGRQLSVNTGR